MSWGGWAHSWCTIKSPFAWTKDVCDLLGALKKAKKEIDCDDFVADDIARLGLGGGEEIEEWKGKGEGGLYSGVVLEEEDDNKNKCVECGVEGEGECKKCGDILCSVCFSALHRKGNRQTHPFSSFSSSPSPSPATSSSPSSSTQESSPSPSSSSSPSSSISSTSCPYATDKFSLPGSPPSTSSSSSTSRSYHANSNGSPSPSLSPSSSRSPSPSFSHQKYPKDWFLARAKYIPVRLHQKERKLLRLLEAGLQSISYTDIVDSTFKNESSRTACIMRELVGMMAGLITACDFEGGKEVVVSRCCDDYEKELCQIYEIGRRYKIMNPDKMRSEYGKLLYFLQDSCSPTIQNNLEMKTVTPIVTVYSFLEERDALDLLRDDLLGGATGEVGGRGKSRFEVQKAIREKERKREALAKKYQSKKISSDELKWCMYSIGDNHSYLHFNCEPIDQMINHLERYFSPDRVEEGFDLAIEGGEKGARLTHSHTKQYYFVLQSLCLWREITFDMFRLWLLAETDLLNSTNPYKLEDTGQGLNRVQNAPLTLRAIQEILVIAQKRSGKWVGSSVIHLGDKNVPNALMFIDKYTQVHRILNPIICTLNQIDKWRNDAVMSNLIETVYGGRLALKKTILADFFRFGFDGSGADNFYDAGSCIDGRLTSAWNWCNDLPNKDFYHVFKFTGFTSFDGDF